MNGSRNVCGARFGNAAVISLLVLIIQLVLFSHSASATPATISEFSEGLDGGAPLGTVAGPDGSLWLGLVSYEGAVPAAATQSSSKFCRPTSATEIRKETSIFALPVGKATPGGSTVVFAVNMRVVKAGGVVFARLLNLGRRTADYGREFAIESFKESRWDLDPASPPGPWPRIQYSLPSDSASRCYRFVVPGDQAPGRYRFSTSVDLQRGAQKPVRRIAEFRVN